MGRTFSTETQGFGPGFQSLLSRFLTYPPTGFLFLVKLVDPEDQIHKQDTLAIQKFLQTCDLDRLVA